MSFADLLEQETQRTPERTIDKILGALGEQDKAEVLDAIRDPRVGATAVSRALWKLAPQFASRGVPYSDKTVTSHPEWRFGE